MAANRRPKLSRDASRSESGAGRRGSGTTDPNARTRLDKAGNPRRHVNLEEKANPTKPQQVHDNNVNRPHSSS